MHAETPNGCFQRFDLPVYKVHRHLLKYLSDKSLDSWIILGETASGKSTQIPQIIFENRLNRGKTIGCTQPRRVAAVSIATYVSQEKKSSLGDLVGYNVRFENVTTDKTKIKYLTDGMLLREALLDPMLKDYGWVILDEVHERTIHTDVLLGIVKKAQKARSQMEHPLKLIVMSATMDVDKFATYFSSAPVIYVEGRTHPVDLFYSPENFEDYSFHCMVTVCQLNNERPVSDGFLVFLTGQEEIDSFCASLKAISKSTSEEEMPTKLHVVPLYAHLPIDMQLQAVKDPLPGTRKVVVATNIAETSITLPGINVVIDSGRIKVKQFVAASQLDILKVQYISQAQAVQRTGRAGRQKPGVCYRLFTEQKFTNLPAVQKPEILRCNLLAVCLELLAMGIKDIYTFDFVDKPSEEHIRSALDQLVWLGAVVKNDINQLTEDGCIMARFPLDPTLSKALLSAQNLGCLKEAIVVVGMLSVESVFHNPANTDQEQKQAAFRCDDGDHVTLLNVYNAFVNNGSKKHWCYEHRVDYRNLCQAEKIVNQLTDIALALDWKLETHGEDTEPLRTSLAAGLFFKAALLQPDHSYKTVFSNRTVFVHPSSSLFVHKTAGKPQPSCVIYTELVLSSKSYMKSISVVNYDDLFQFVPLDLRWRLSDCPHEESTRNGNGIKP